MNDSERETDDCPACGGHRRMEYGSNESKYILWWCGRVEDGNGRVSKPCQTAPEDAPQ
jgi:hypothetical protein